MTPAPYYRDLASGPAPEAQFVRAADGTRLRVAIWHAGKQGGQSGAPRGTILFAQGRSEYLEKYGNIIPLFLDRGFNVAAVDFRGQGLSDRPLGHTRSGDIEDFSLFQQDMTALTEHIQSAGLPGPRILVAHSMGGCIGLRAILNGLNVQAAVFSAPMWGVKLPWWSKPIARPLAGLVNALRLGHLRVPGTGAASYCTWAEPETNLLTSDPAAYQRQRDILLAAPDIGLGGPSFRWMSRALSETASLARSPNPPIPILTFLGGDEDVVATEAITTRMALPGQCTLVTIPGGRHEMYFETQSIRDELWQQTDRFLDALA